MVVFLVIVINLGGFATRYSICSTTWAADQMPHVDVASYDGAVPQKYILGRSFSKSRIFFGETRAAETMMQSKASVKNPPEILLVGFGQKRATGVG